MRERRNLSPTLDLWDMAASVTKRITLADKKQQWNLRTRDTLGLIVLSLVERLSISEVK